MLLLPVVGVILYILFSGHFFTGTKNMNKANTLVSRMTEPLIAEQKKFLAENKNNLPRKELIDFFPLLDMNLTKGESILVPSDSVEIFTEGQDFFDALKHDIEKAETSIFMEYFIFKEDKIGKEIMELLCQKAKAGVEVKLLYDDFGCLFTPTRFFSRLKAAGGEAIPFFQIRIGLPLTLNYRNHRKLTVIDSKTAYTGGTNIGDEYRNASKKVKLNWRDTSIRLTGSVVLNLQTNFYIDWYSIVAWNEKKYSMKKIAEHYPSDVIEKISTSLEEKKIDVLVNEFFTKDSIPTQIVVAGPDDAHKAEIEDALIRMIMNAEKSVYIQTPYFTPDEQFITAIKLAVFSGVDVRIMIPGEWDKFYVKATSFEYARTIVNYGAKVYLYPGFIHSKTITVDSKVCSIGTTNIDNRSFYLDFEQNLFFYDKELAQKFENIFLDDLQLSECTDKDFFDKAPMIKRAWWSFAKLFSPFM